MAGAAADGARLPDVAQMKVTLAKLSVCPCGHPLLKPSIGLGTEYEIEPDVKVVTTLICGGCGSRRQLPAVFVHSRAGGTPGWLPEEAFSHISK
jgi:hypothetical protein